MLGAHLFRPHAPTGAAAGILQEPRRQRALIACVALGAFLINLDSYIISIALPAIAHSFHVGTSLAALVTVVYLLALSSTLLFFGKLGDRLGLKRVFAWGYGLFTLGSLLCGIAPNLTSLLLARALQGLGGAMLYAVGPPLLPRWLPAGMQGWAFGLVMTAGAGGIALGAPVGGFIVSLLGWPWVFLLNVPVGLLALYATLRALPDDAPPATREHAAPFDVAGALMSGAGVLLLVFACNQGEELGWTSPPILAGFVLAFLALAFFWRRERAHTAPLMDPAMFCIPAIALGNLAALLAYMLLAGGNFLLPFYLVGVKGLRIEQAGLVLLAYAAVFAALCPGCGRLADRLPPQRLCAAGMALATAAALLFAFTLHTPGLWAVLLYLVLLAPAYALFISACNNLVLGHAPAGEIGMVSGVFKTATNMSLVLGVCLLETVFSAGHPVAGAALPPDSIAAGLHRALLLGALTSLLASISVVLIRFSRPVPRQHADGMA